MSSAFENRPVEIPCAPQYPFETVGKNKLAREKLERSLQSRASLQSASLKSFHQRNHRLHGYGNPPIVNSTQQLLCLTPNRSGFLPKKTRNRNSALAKVQRFNEMEHLPYMASVATLITSDSIMGPSTVTSPTPPTTHRSLPASRPTMYYKHTRATPSGSKRNTPTSAKSNFEANIRYKPPTPPISARQTLNRKEEGLKIYRNQLQSYFGPRRSDTNIIGRKMAPVLRVLPAASRTRPKNQLSAKKAEKLPDETEATSQKKVRFSDQLGFPLVRNMTPNYKRKHSYILRWLETAGRSNHSLG